MAKDQDTYTTAERSSYQWPPCPECGGGTIGQWVSVNDISSTEDKWIPGTYRCANASSHRR